MLDYSIVIPIYNEEQNIIPLFHELDEVLNRMEHSFEIFFIDDGSKDNSRSIIQTIATTHSYVRLIGFKQNCGQSAAFDAGFKAAHGKYVITLDGDGQNNPQDIPRLLAIAQKEDYDLVCGRRKHRQDSWNKQVTSKLANFVRQSILQDGINDTGCSLKIFRKDALNTIRLYKGMHRFLPALFQIEGYKIKEIVVDHRPRKAGKSKYNIFNRGLQTISDLFVVAWMQKRRLRYEIDHG